VVALTKEMKRLKWGIDNQSKNKQKKKEKETWQKESFVF
jgi:hypothetical protein